MHAGSLPEKPFEKNWFQKTYEKMILKVDRSYKFFQVCLLPSLHIFLIFRYNSDESDYNKQIIIVVKLGIMVCHLSNNME